MPIQAFAFEIKSINAEQGTFTGLASTYSNTDLGGDSCQPGCFTKTLQQGGAVRPLLLGHRDAVGIVELRDSPQGLVADGKLTMAVQQAKDSFELLKSGALRGLSLGYLPTKEPTYANGIRMLSEVKIFEISLTPIPMNEQAVVLGYKSAQQNQIQTALASFHRELLSALEKRQ